MKKIFLFLFLFSLWGFGVHFASAQIFPPDTQTIITPVQTGEQIDLPSNVNVLGFQIVQYSNSIPKGCDDVGLYFNCVSSDPLHPYGTLYPTSSDTNFIPLNVFCSSSYFNNGNGDCQYMITAFYTTDNKLFSNPDTNTSFYLDHSLNYGDILILIFIIIFFAFGVLKFIWNFFNKDANSKL